MHVKQTSPLDQFICLAKKEQLSKMNMIEQVEHMAVLEMLKNGQLPNCSSFQWKAILAHYSLPDPVSCGNKLSKVTLPPGWSVTNDLPDQRRGTIRDHQGEEVGTFFYSGIYYKIHGYLSFSDARLAQLGII